MKYFYYSITKDGSLIMNFFPQVFGGGYHYAIHPSGEVHVRVDVPEPKYFPLDVDGLKNTILPDYEQMTNATVRLPRDGIPTIMMLTRMQALSDRLSASSSRKIMLDTNELLNEVTAVEVGDSGLIRQALDTLHVEGYAGFGDMAMMFAADTGEILGSFLYSNIKKGFTCGPERMMSEMQGIPCVAEIEKFSEIPFIRKLSEPFQAAMECMQSRGYQLGELPTPKLNVFQPIRTLKFNPE